MSDATCPTCGDIPNYLPGYSSKGMQRIKGFRKRLKAIPGANTYYRNSGNLTRFKLRRCPTCGTYFEDAHHYYSDPQSTMGLGRDEDDWYALERLSAEVAEKRLRQLG
ncbi:MAG: hypothetical protein EA366_03930 [Spirulina sp. DLM2.Bin59]|nr:MAG: hypothetical protein EA366_03930 [Spirulina sp. DLM2.Bin59]